MSVKNLKSTSSQSFPDGNFSMNSSVSLVYGRDVIKTGSAETKTKTTRFKTKTKTGPIKNKTETKTRPVETKTKTMLAETAKAMRFAFTVSKQNTKQTLTFH